MQNGQQGEHRAQPGNEAAQGNWLDARPHPGAGHQNQAGSSSRPRRGHQRNPSSGPWLALGQLPAAEERMVTINSPTTGEQFTFPVGGQRSRHHNVQSNEVTSVTEHEAYDRVPPDQKWDATGRVAYDFCFLCESYRGQNERRNPNGDGCSKCSIEETKF